MVFDVSFYIKYFSSIFEEEKNEEQICVKFMKLNKNIKINLKKLICILNFFNCIIKIVF